MGRTTRSAFRLGCAAIQTRLGFIRRGGTALMPQDRLESIAFNALLTV
jgi:hypothetical protein